MKIQAGNPSSSTTSTSNTSSADASGTPDSLGLGNFFSLLLSGLMPNPTVDTTPQEPEEQERPAEGEQLALQTYSAPQAQPLFKPELNEKMQAPQGLPPEALPSEALDKNENSLLEAKLRQVLQQAVQTEVPQERVEALKVPKATLPPLPQENKTEKTEQTFVLNKLNIPPGLNREIKPQREAPDFHLPKIKELNNPADQAELLYAPMTTGLMMDKGKEIPSMKKPEESLALTRELAPEIKMEIQVPHLKMHKEDAIYNASIKIYPPELGEVLAKIKMTKGSAELVIEAENNTVKEIVQANLTQLRDSFLQAGIELKQIQVDVNSGQAQAQNSEKDRQFKPEEPNFVEGQAQPRKELKVQQTLDTLIDTYV